MTTETDIEAAARDARNAMRCAKEVYYSAIRKAFPIGRRITYSHGEHLVQCDVIGHGYRDDLRVRGLSGKTYMIDAYRALYK